jgi:Xaa-Pro aminopeptidase
VSVAIPSSITVEEYQQRVDACRRIADEHGLDALIAWSDSRRPGHVLYLTGHIPFNGTAMVVITAETCELVVDADWDLAAAQAAAWLDDSLVRYAADYARAARDIVGTAQARIGIIGFDLLSAAVFARLRESTDWSFTDVGRSLDRLRAIKSPAEIGLLREACRISDAGAEAFRTTVRAGLSELDVAVAVESAIKLAGTPRLTFPTNLGSGERTLLVSPAPTRRVLADGDLVLLDCGGTFGGYCGDMSRTTVVGTPSAAQRRQLDVALEMFEACREQLRPGVELRTVHSTAERIAAANGFAYEFATGHSIGCENHELPDIDGEATAILEPNMVVAVEPAIIVDGVGGVRLEDTFLITEDAAEPLTADPMKLWE